MAVLPDADKGNVDGAARRRRGVGEDRVEIGVAVEEMKARNPVLVEEVFAQEFSKAGRMG